MSIADKLLQVNQVKQDIKTAIETKGIPMTNVAFTEYANKILEISGGGGVVDEYFYYAKSYYTITNNATLFANAWQDSQDSETVLYDIPLELAEANNEDLGGVDLYVGTNDQLEKLYNDCVNGVATIPFESENGIYIFGDIENPFDERPFFILDSVAVLGKDLGIVLGKFVPFSIPNNNIVIKQGFKFENENGIIIPESVTSIGSFAFYEWTSNNQPLVIPNSVTSIGSFAFYKWSSNNQPLVIPESVTSIGGNAFENWTSNTHPLVIPNSVTSIESSAFYGWELVPYVEIKAVIPPSLAGSGAFSSQNNAPIYVPDASVDDYKTATNWINLASRIFSINDK